VGVEQMSRRPEKWNAMVSAFNDSIRVVRTYEQKKVAGVTCDPVRPHRRQLSHQRALGRAQHRRGELRSRVGEGRDGRHQGSAQPPAHAARDRRAPLRWPRARGPRDVPDPWRLRQLQFRRGQPEVRRGAVQVWKIPEGYTDHAVPMSPNRPISDTRREKLAVRVPVAAAARCGFREIRRKIDSPPSWPSSCACHGWLAQTHWRIESITMSQWRASRTSKEAFP
jgi:hypothetical protein